MIQQDKTEIANEQTPLNGMDETGKYNDMLPSIASCY